MPPTNGDLLIRIDERTQTMQGDIAEIKEGMKDFQQRTRTLETHVGILEDRQSRRTALQVTVSAIFSTIAAYVGMRK